MLDEILERLTKLPEANKRELAKLVASAAPIWTPNVGPQTSAFFCQADELLYGGQAGGGKSDLLLGLAVTQHKRSLILRRINKDAVKLVSRLTEILGSRDGYNGQLQKWMGDGRQIDFGGCEYDDDKQRYKGDPHDFIGFDEGSDFLETQYRFIIGWLRSTDPAQRCRVVVATNPPTTAEGLWIVKRWAAWLDPNHPKPAAPGELRWYITIGSEDVEVEGPGPHLIEGRQERAMSRTFIPAELSDNPDLARTNYSAVLAGLPEELRRAYKEGDFSVGLKDDDYQVLPTGWIDAAMQRWKDDGHKGFPMTAMALDVAPGGGDQMCLAWRYGGWVAPLEVMRTVDKDGNVAAGLVVKHRRNNAPVVVDVGGGWGGDAIVRLKDNGISVIAFNGVQASNRMAKGGKLKFRNKRAEMIWRVREELDPTQEHGSCVALPPDPELKADLASYRWQLTSGGILIESKEEIKKRIGRSPDKGDAVTMVLHEGSVAVDRVHRKNNLPQVNIGYSTLKRGH